MHHWNIKMLRWTCQTPASEDLLAEHNKRGNLEFDYVTSLNCDLAHAAKYPRSILNPHLNAVREFPSNSHITLYNMPCHAIWKRNAFEMAALEPISAKEPLNATVFQGEFKDSSLQKQTNKQKIYFKQHDTHWIRIINECFGALGAVFWFSTLGKSFFCNRSCYWLHDRQLWGISLIRSSVCWSFAQHLFDTVLSSCTVHFSPHICTVRSKIFNKPNKKWTQTRTENRAQILVLRETGSYFGKASLQLSF